MYPSPLDRLPPLLPPKVGIVPDLFCLVADSSPLDIRPSCDGTPQGYVLSWGSSIRSPIQTRELPENLSCRMYWRSGLHPPSTPKSWITLLTSYRPLSYCLSAPPSRLRIQSGPSPGIQRSSPPPKNAHRTERSLPFSRDPPLLSAACAFSLCPWHTSP